MISISSRHPATSDDLKEGGRTMMDGTKMDHNKIYKNLMKMSTIKNERTPTFPSINKGGAHPSVTGDKAIMNEQAEHTVSSSNGLTQGIMSLPVESAGLVTSETLKEYEMEQDIDDNSYNYEQDRIETENWYNMQEEEIEITPKYLIISDKGNPRFSKVGGHKRIAWLGIALGISLKELPIMREFNTEGQSYISLEIINPEENKQLVEKLLNTTKLGPCQVKITKDERKNSVKGTIRDVDFFIYKLKQEHDRILEEKAMEAGGAENQKFNRNTQNGYLKSKGIIDIKTLGKDNTRMYLLTFNQINCPQEIKFPEFGRIFKVQEYIPNPLKCYNCQKYGHPGRQCHKNTRSICQRCGEYDHTFKKYNNGTLTQQCFKEPKCYHCDQNHMAGDRDCEVYKKHKKVNEIIVLQKIPRYEAMMREFSQKKNSTYNQVIAKSIEVQKNDESQKKEIMDLGKKLDSIVDILRTETDRKIQNVVNGAKTDDRENTDQLNLQQIIKEEVRKANEATKMEYEKMLEEKITEAVAKANKEMKEYYDEKIKVLEANNSKNEKRMQELKNENEKLKQETKEKESKAKDDKKEIASLKKQLAETKEKLENSPKRKVAFRDSSSKSDEFPKSTMPKLESEVYGGAIPKFNTLSGKFKYTKKESKDKKTPSTPKKSNTTKQ